MNTKHTLLVVDDEDVVRDLIGCLFDGQSQVVEASDGFEGIQKALQYMPDCILLDLQLPGMGGIGVCQTLKQIRQTHSIPIIMLSGKNSSEDMRLATEHGASDFVTKPFQLADLRRRVLEASPYPFKERRKNTRHELAMPIRIEGSTPGGGFRVHTRTEDVSRTGLRFYGEFRARQGDTIQIHTLSCSPGDTSTYAGKARIVWVDTRYSPLIHYGARFEEVPTSSPVNSF